jgi:Holliday junction resolvase RusA-like endonuclease
LIKFTIPFKLPSLNEHIKKVANNRYGGGKYKKDIENQIIKIVCQLEKIDKPVYIKFTWYEKTTRRDKDNVAFSKKYILDALQKAGVLPNDNNQYVKGFEDRFVYKQGDKVEVEIFEI